MKNRTHLIVGAGEVGVALKEVLGGRWSVEIRDVEGGPKGSFGVLHICFPPGKGFVRAAKNYVRQYHPEIVVVHSTVPVGTTRKIGQNAVHSPIRGVHPHLAKGILTFEKYFGGARALEAAADFEAAGVKTKTFPKPETTELLKILDTTYYGWNIVFAKEAKRICDELGLDFEEVYTEPNSDYNRGYRELGMPQVVRPVLKAMPGKIGGHCVIPNTKLLADWLTDTLRNRNDKY